MAHDEHTLFVGENEYKVQLVLSDYEGSLNQRYVMTFHCIPKGEDKLKVICIAVTDRTINMWNAVGGNNEIKEDKELFAWQIVQYYLPQLSDNDTIKLFIHRDDNSSAPEGFNPIQASRTISETARKIIFSGNKPSNNLIRREILKVCYNEWQTNPHSFVSKQQLVKFIPISEVELERNIDYLVRTYFINGDLTSAGYLMVKITPQGIDVFEDPTEFNKRFSLRIEQQTYNVGGDMIVTHLMGNDNKTMIKSDVENN